MYMFRFAALPVVQVFALLCFRLRQLLRLRRFR
jgi:hypothetical protein